MEFTGIQEIDQEILLGLSYENIVNTCQTSQYFYELCQDPTFWREKVRRDYGSEILKLKPPDESYREQVYRLSRPGYFPHDAYQVALNGYLDELVYFKREGFEITPEIISKAAEGGHSEILNWALANGVQPNLSWLTGALQGGQLEIANWMFSQGFLPSRGTVLPSGMYYHAIRHGRLESVKWLLQHQVPIPRRIWRYTGKHGQLEILKYMAEIYQVLPDTEEDLHEIAVHGRHQVLKWLGQKPGPESIQMVMRILRLLRNPEIIDPDAALILFEAWPSEIHGRVDPELIPYDLLDLRAVTKPEEYQEIIDRYEETLDYLTS
jgi:hypothetical protein